MATFSLSCPPSLGADDGGQRQAQDVFGQQDAFQRFLGLLSSVVALETMILPPTIVLPESLGVAVRILIGPAQQQQRRTGGSSRNADAVQRNGAYDEIVVTRNSVLVATCVALSAAFGYSQAQTKTRQQIHAASGLVVCGYGLWRFDVLRRLKNSLWRCGVLPGSDGHRLGEGEGRGGGGLLFGFGGYSAETVEPRPEEVRERRLRYLESVAASGKK